MGADRRSVMLSRTWPVRVATAVVTVTTLVAVTAPPARAAGGAAGLTCRSPVPVLAQDADGTLWRYDYRSLAGDDPVTPAPVPVATGWRTTDRLVGGPDGTIYAIGADTVVRRRGTGDGTGGWSEAPISNLVQEGEPVSRTGLTVDERGDIYRVTLAGPGGVPGGILARSTFATPSATRPTGYGDDLDVGWDRFDLVVAAGQGVFYARTPDGRLYRYRLDLELRRWFGYGRYLGGGWDRYGDRLFSAGGDTLLGVDPDGTLVEYHYGEEIGDWDVAARPIATGWSRYRNVLSYPDGCGSPPPRSAPIELAVTPGTPTSVSQLPTGRRYPTNHALAVSYVDRDGGLFESEADPDPDTGLLLLVGNSAMSWLSGGRKTFVDQPSMTVSVIGRRMVLHIVVHDAHGRVWETTRAAPAPLNPAFTAMSSLGGGFPSRPLVVQFPDQGRLIAAVDTDGTTWTAPEQWVGESDHRTLTGPLAWRPASAPAPSPASVPAPASAGAPVAVTGLLAAAVTGDRRAVLVGAGAAGTLAAAGYQDGVLSPWRSLGGSGFTGTPAVVVAPGGAVRVFARGSDGRILTQQQGGDGAFPGPWTPVGDAAVAGSPAAILDPVLRRLVVAARGPDGTISLAWETGTGSGAWGGWSSLPVGPAEPAATDPTLAPLTTPAGAGWVVAYRDAADRPHAFQRLPDPGGDQRAPDPGGDQRGRWSA